MKVKAIIADDEALVRERIVDLLSEYSNIEIVSQCDNGQATIEAINLERPDVLFLDIKMPQFGGFEVMERVEQKDILLIFITAFDQYALKAFDYEAFDYIVKPIVKKRFEKTISRVIKVLGRSNQTDIPVLNIKVNGVVHRVNPEQITYLEAADNYVILHAGDKQYKKRGTITKLTASLAAYGVIRVHRSYAINRYQIQSMSRIYKGDYLIKLKNAKIIPTSQAYSEVVKELLG